MIFFVHMSLITFSLNSGSNGNCYYIGNDSEAVLIDAGLSCRETEKRLKLAGLSMKKVKAIFISHEHIDHIKGASMLAGKYELPVMITGNTLKAGSLKLKKHLVGQFTAAVPLMIGKLEVTAFRKFHDAADPHSFIVSCKGVTIGVFTDIGRPCDKLVKHFKQCHAAYLEANYDEMLLEKGRYPVHLKNRIRGGNGHLSNAQALELFTSHRPAFMTHLFLAHLSKENNSPGLVLDLFNQYAKGTHIAVASRYEPTAVYYINHPEQLKATGKPVKSIYKADQLTLF